MVRTVMVTAQNKLAIPLAVLCLAMALSSVAGQTPEISSSILVFGPGDYVQNGGTSRCQQVVRNALAYKQSSLMFVPTAFWVDRGYLDRKSVNSQGNVTYYCHNRQTGGGNTPTTCPEATQAEIDLFKTSMAACFKTAVDAGMNIAISPHLDDGLGYGGWRNGLIFDPLQKYGQWSYADFFLYPLADALAQSVTPSTRVRFGMQGEMSATVVYNPSSYTKLLSLLKDRVQLGAPSGFPRSNIQVGVSTNFNKLCGCVLQDLVDTNQYVQQYPAAFAPLKSQFNFTAISELYNAVDYIGISSYPSLKPGFPTQQLELATEQYDFEIGQFGIDLKDLNVRQGKPLYWNEYGLGGGISQNGDQKATTAEQAAAYPFFGVFGSYSRNNDPWALYDLSQPSGPRSYQEYYYAKTVEYAQQTGKNSTFKYRVSGIYIWSTGTWDVQAIYPESKTQEGSYKNSVITDQLNTYNQQVITQTGQQTSSGTGATSTSPTSSASSSGGTTVNPSAASSGAGSSSGAGTPGVQTSG